MVMETGVCKRTQCQSCSRTPDHLTGTPLVGLLGQVGALCVLTAVRGLMTIGQIQNRTLVMPLSPEQKRRRADQQRERRVRNRDCASPYCGRPAARMLEMKRQYVALCVVCHEALERAGATGAQDELVYSD